MRAATLSAVGLVMALGAGCTRTSDGTVVVTSPPGYTWVRDRVGETGRVRPRRLRRAEPEPSVAYYPPAPSAPVVEAPPPRRTMPRPRRVAEPSRQQRTPSNRLIGVPFEPTRQGDLACRNEQSPGGRVKVVCD